MELRRSCTNPLISEHTQDYFGRNTTAILIHKYSTTATPFQILAACLRRDHCLRCCDRACRSVAICL